MERKNKLVSYFLERKSKFIKYCRIPSVKKCQQDLTWPFCCYYWYFLPTFSSKVSLNELKTLQTMHRKISSALKIMDVIVSNTRPQDSSKDKFLRFWPVLGTFYSITPHKMTINPEIWKIS